MRYLLTSLPSAWNRCTLWLYYIPVIDLFGFVSWDIIWVKGEVEELLLVSCSSRAVVSLQVFVDFGCCWSEDWFEYFRAPTSCSAPFEEELCPFFEVVLPAVLLIVFSDEAADGSFNATLLGVQIGVACKGTDGLFLVGSWKDPVILDPYCKVEKIYWVCRC